MKLLKILTVISLFILPGAMAYSQSSSTADASQSYNNAIGVRFGGLTSGLTFKHIGQSQGAFEGLLSFSHRTFVITGLYEKYKDIESSPGLRWFYGGGAHIGFFRYGGYYYWVNKKGKFVYVDGYDGPSRTVVGLDFIIGLDYKFKDAPFDISLDLKPFVDFWDGPYGYFDGALSVRFTF
jgi:hypothetical protein